MAAVAGALIAPANPYGASGKNVPKEGALVGLSGTSAGAIIYYKKRAIDSGGLPLAYVTWVATSPTAAYTGVLPYGGPLIDEAVVDSWSA